MLSFVGGLVVGAVLVFLIMTFTPINEERIVSRWLRKKAEILPDNAKNAVENALKKDKSFYFG